VEFVLLRLNHR